MSILVNFFLLLVILSLIKLFIEGLLRLGGLFTIITKKVLYLLKLQMRCRHAPIANTKFHLNYNKFLCYTNAVSVIVGACAGPLIGLLVGIDTEMDSVFRMGLGGRCCGGNVRGGCVLLDPEAFAGVVPLPVAGSGTGVLSDVSAPLVISHSYSLLYTFYIFYGGNSIFPEILRSQAEFIGNLFKYFLLMWEFVIFFFN